MKISGFVKSILSGISAGSAAAIAAAQDNVISTGEGVTITLAVIGAWGIVYAVPNKSAKGPQQ
ncbi:hypothetical protein OHA71_06330 [Streptomyces sp. NBC_00444]|uniref:hypothetical protein n=1 Tax=Streptomyces sp. NBC_00444 TaxID=2975744 RepID=UPI002E1C6681